MTSTGGLEPQMSHSYGKRPNRRRVSQLRPQIDLKRQRLNNLLGNGPIAGDVTDALRELHALLYRAKQTKSAKQA